MTGRWTVGQLVLRTLVLLGPVVAVAATGPVGTPPSGWLLILTALLSAGFAVAPESPLGSVVMLMVLAWWGVALRDGLHPVALVAAAGLLTAHVAATLAAYGPEDLPVDPALARIWLGRAGLVFLAAPVTWAFATVLRGRPEPPGIWLAGMAAAAVAAVIASTAFPAAEEES